MHHEAVVTPAPHAVCLPVLRLTDRGRHGLRDPG
jgi:hypothetical protein